MSNTTAVQTAPQKQENPVIAMFKSESTKERFAQIMDKNAPAFISSILAMATQNESLAKCTPITVFTAAMTAASLNLQVSPTLGQAYIIPYGNAAQFQLGYKGLRQLAIRSGQYIRIKAIPIYEGQLVEHNPLHGYKFDFSIPNSGTPVGYYAYYELTNGFTDDVYWTMEQVKAHRAKYSKSGNGSTNPWNSEFDKMACKTVLKQVLNGGPMSTEMQKAMMMDGAVRRTDNEDDIEFAPVEEVADDATEASALLEILQANEPLFDPTEYKAMKLILTSGKTAEFDRVKKALEGKGVTL